MEKIDLASSIRAAGRRHLAPHGLRQKGRSRFWLDDRRWFVIGVEFQPGRGKGSYLNVGCCWLWYAKPYFSYDLGSRELGFEAFTSSAEWEQVVDRMARHASELVIHYRSLATSPIAVADYYRSHRPHDFWHMYHAGVASALTKRTQEAREHLTAAAAQELSDSPDWARDAAESCRLLMKLLDSPADLVSRVEAQVQHARNLMKLPPVTNPFAL